MITDHQEPYRWNNQEIGTIHCKCSTNHWYDRPVYTKVIQSTTQNANMPLVLGPVITAALPALDDILSHDSTQALDFAKPPSPLGQPPVPPSKLDDVPKSITTQFQSTDSLMKGVEESVDNLSSEMQTGFASIESYIDTAIADVEKRQEIRDDHEANMVLVKKISIAQ
jgi:hypothetical protein